MSDDDRRAARTITSILDRAWIQDASHNIVAAEIIQALRGHGWRPTNAHPTPGLEHRHGQLHPDPTPEYLAERQAINTGRTTT